MSFLDECEEKDMEEFLQNPTIELFQRSRHMKFLSETISTNSCTIEIDRPSHKTSVSKLFDTHSDVMTGKKLSKKRIFELPERLNFLKQITENKIKFMKLEQNNKELEECTFRPKTNVKAARVSVSQFLKHQEDYTKAKNSAEVKLKLKNLGQLSCRNCKAGKAPEALVFDRLYRDSRILPRSMRRVN